MIVWGIRTVSFLFAAKKNFFLFFLPRESLLCKKHLIMEGVLGSLTIREWPCDIFPLDKDLLSLELNDSFRELYVEGDPTCLYQAAKALVALQRLYGRIPKVCGKGDYAEKLWKMTKAMTIIDEVGSEKGLIDELIILERPIDLMSALATQLTYEGLVDEVYGIKCTAVQIPSQAASKLTAISTAADQKTLHLNSGDHLFQQLRDKNFNAVGQILNRQANTISSQMGEQRSENMAEMRKFVERLPQIMASKQALADHTAIAGNIKEVTQSHAFLDALACEQEFMQCSDVDRPCPFIEDSIAKEAPLQSVIRLICMQSIAGTGLKQKVLDHYKRALVQTYGIKVLLPLASLERAGLIRPQTGTRAYAVLRKTLKLTVNESSEVCPDDISYVHSFYAPLTIRLVEHYLRPSGVSGGGSGWSALSDVMARIPGATFDDVLSTADGRRNSFSSDVSTTDYNGRTVMVFFLGGCTFAEVAALRFLSQQPEHNVEFLVATTKVINKNSFLAPFLETHFQ